MRKAITALATMALVLALALPAWAGMFPLNIAVFTIGSTTYTMGPVATNADGTAYVFRNNVPYAWYTNDPQTFQMDVAPVIVSGRTLLPIRYVAEGMGIPDSDIAYLPQSTIPGYSQDQEVDITQSYEYKGIRNTVTSVILYNTSDLQDAVVLINRNSSHPISFVKQYGAAPQIINGRLMVPLRAVIQTALGTSVSWDGNSNQVTVISPQNN